MRRKRALTNLAIGIGMLFGTLYFVEQARSQGHPFQPGMSLQELKAHVEEKGNVDLPVDAEQRTVLMLAAAHGDTNVVAEILDKGAKIDIADGSGRTALMYASERGNKASVQMLVKNGAHLNVRDSKSKESALMLAAQNGRKDIVEFLVESDADLDLRDRDGGTAWSRAKAKGHKDIADYLQRHGASTSLVLTEITKETADLAKRELSAVANAMALWRLAKGKGADDVPVWDDLVGYLRPGDPLAARAGKDVFGNPLILRSCSKGPAVDQRTLERLRPVTGEEKDNKEFWGKYLEEE